MIQRQNSIRFGVCRSKGGMCGALHRPKKWGLADCESLSVEADRLTLTLDDFATVMDLLKFRPMQLALVLKVLVGAEEMQRMMIGAIGVAKRQE